MYLVLLIEQLTSVYLSIHCLFDVGMQSPRQLSKNVSPSMSMLSVHSAANQTGHMVPVMGPGNYPSPNAGSFVPPMYRHAVEAGELIFDHWLNLYM